MPQIRRTRLNRREFIKLAGILAGTTAGVSCASEKRVFLPYIVPPEKEIVPGELVYYSTTCTRCSANCGINARVVEKIYRNRRIYVPVKLEGNPLHPVNKGALCLRGQASISTLYAYGRKLKEDLFDRLYKFITGEGTQGFETGNERLLTPLAKSKDNTFVKISWEDALRMIKEKYEESRNSGHKNYLLSSHTSGTISELIETFCNNLNIVRLPEFISYSHATLREANRRLFNNKSIPFYRIEDADLLITLGADVVETFVSPVNYSSQISRAKMRDDFRWIHVEPHISITGISAHHRFVIRAGREKWLLLYFLKNMRRKSAIVNRLPDISIEKASEITGLTKDDILFILKLINSAQQPLIIAGGVSTENDGGLETAMLAGLLQFTSGNTGLLDFSLSENYGSVGSYSDLVEFSKLLERENSGIVFIHDSDPLGNLAGAYNFKDGLKKAKFTVGFSEFMNKTMSECELVLPLSDPLESWGDAEPHAGLRCIIQPTTEPLFGTFSSGDLFLKIMETLKNKPAGSYQEFLLRRWRREGGESYIEKLLNEGYVQQRVEPRRITLNEGAIDELLRKLKESENSSPVLVISGSLRGLYNEREDNPLLSEIPDPLSSVSYGEWVSVSLEDAEELHIKDGELVEIAIDSKSMSLPAKVQPGLNAGVYSLHREFLKSDFINLTPHGDIARVIYGIKIRKTGSIIEIPILSGSQYQQGRGIVPEHNHTKQHKEETRHTLYPEPHHKEYRWAMVIDLELCTGCSACVAACYVENNVPVVGKKLHLEGRELSWIRIETFFDGEKPYMIPMLCQQCDFAPCESVCPVYATYHNPEGLNAQVYNRCVGTRYCANNCPYKVRRFNWFNFRLEGFRALQYNPDVWVRPRGVMEKCTFCIQRIRRAEDKAKDEGRMVKDGEIIPACAQTCPSGAITFGNILDTKSKVHKLAHSERAYRVFEHLGIEPAVYYLKKRQNLNKENL